MSRNNTLRGPFFGGTTYTRTSENMDSLETLSEISTNFTLPTTLGKYQLERQLGKGGMGVVYAAKDVKWERSVAVKLLPKMTAHLLQRFKFEFRCTADISHHNLVTLYELAELEGIWYLAMELVDGKNLGSYFFDHPQGQINPNAPLVSHKLEHILDTFRQLAKGISAMHKAHVLHLDIKPENILIEPSGRTVLLDFGLARPSGIRPNTDHKISFAGTPAYMAPEQISGQPPTTATDWYSFGAVLFHILTSRLPIIGSSAIELIRKKTVQQPPRPGDICKGLPDYLDELCFSLLNIDSSKRPTQKEILKSLGSDKRGFPISFSNSKIQVVDKNLLIGRKNEQRILQNAYKQSQENTLCVLVKGPAGIGKSAFVQSFLRSIEGPDQPLILEGACYEREDVPYKGLDSLIDSLANYLGSCPRLLLRTLLPKDMDVLATLFPVLRNNNLVGEHLFTPGISPSNQRQRAFRALKTLLARICEHRQTVLFIDNLQWGDEDSTRLMQEIITPSSPMLFISAYRTNDLGHRSFIQDLLTKWETPRVGHIVTSITLNSLPIPDAIQLAKQIFNDDIFSILSQDTLEEGSPDGSLTQSEMNSLTKHIAKEADGNPFLIEQLSRYHQITRAMAAYQYNPDKSLLVQVLEAHTNCLEPSIQKLFEVVAVAGRPIRQNVAIKASNLTGDASKALVILNSHFLVRTASNLKEDYLECYHDRFHEAIVELLSAEEIKKIHLSIANALEALAQTDHDALTLHWYKSGNPTIAATYAQKAAEKAAIKLAFDRASKGYQQALSWGNFSQQERFVLQLARAGTLINSGRGAEAAEQYIAALEFAEPDQVFSIKRQAAEQFLFSGHVDEGLKILREQLPQFGMKYPKSPGKAFLGIFTRFSQLKLRGINFQLQEPDKLDPTLLSKIDLAHSFAKGLMAVDPIRGIYFGFSSLLLALKSGDPTRIAWSFAFVGNSISTSGGSFRDWGQEMLNTAETIAESTQDPYLRGIKDIFSGQARLFTGNWTEALEECEGGIKELQRKCKGSTWEQNFGKMGLLRALEELGLMSHCIERSTQFLTEAEGVGDLYATVTFMMYAGYTYLAQDRPESARKMVTNAMKKWSQREFLVQHFYAQRLEAMCDIYEGNPLGAFEGVSQIWPKIKSSHMLRVAVTRVDALLLRARVTLAVLERSSTDKSRLLIKSCKGDIRTLKREKRQDVDACVALLESALCSLEGNEEKAAQLSLTAIDDFESCSMSLMSACASLRWGQLAHNKKGTQTARNAIFLMGNKGILSVPKWADLHAPGFPGTALYPGRGHKK